MGKWGVLILMLATLILLAMPAGAFIGTGIGLSKHMGDTINFGFGEQVNAADTGFGMAGMDLGVTWGVDYDLNTLAGYGSGAVGAVTDANLGYSLGLSMDEAHAVGFDGSAFDVPLAQGTVERTSFNNFISNNQHIQSANFGLPFSGFPVM